MQTAVQNRTDPTPAGSTLGTAISLIACLALVFAVFVAGLFALLMPLELEVYGCLHSRTLYCNESLVVTMMILCLVVYALATVIGIRGMCVRFAQRRRAWVWPVLALSIVLVVFAVSLTLLYNVFT